VQEVWCEARSHVIGEISDCATKSFFRTVEEESDEEDEEDEEGVAR
jgi:hypothetical protein